MEWKDKPRSSNVEDRRGQSGGGGFSPSGGGFNIPMGGGKLGSFGLIVLVIFFLLRSGILGGLFPQPQQTNPYQNEQGQVQVPATEDDMGNFAMVNLKFTEDVWSQVFSASQLGAYQTTNMVLFSGSTQSGCGFASAQTGPFYCPADGKVYIDLSFYEELKNRFGASGDFAMAYVIYHEVGHHVQNLLGVTDRMQEIRGQVSQEEYNRLSVRLELQADFLAGVVARHLQERGDVLEPGDIEEAVNAAEAIGDDRIQKQTQGYVVPDSFTHGTSAQRARWFMKGYNSGSFQGSDTFSIDYNNL